MMDTAHCEDRIDVVGEVRKADLDASTFVLRVNGDFAISGRFDPQQEALLTEALHDHETHRIRVRGRTRTSVGELTRAMNNELADGRTLNEVCKRVVTG